MFLLLLTARYNMANLSESMVFNASCSLVLSNASLLHLNVGRDVSEGSTTVRILLLQFQTLCHQTSYVDAAVSCLQWRREK